MNSLLNTAVDAALAAGKILTANFRKVESRQIEEKTKGDFLSFVDRESENTIVNIINDTYPEHSILAEESGLYGGRSGFEWIIDPLDGTRNYLNGIPVFSVSIALKQDGELVIGVIYEPVRKELFTARAGSGSFLNGQPIQVSDIKQMNKGLLATGFPFKNRTFTASYMNCFEAVFERCNGIRRMGSAALDLAYVAAGRLDGFWELGLQPWDMAAGALLVKEAGGRVRDFWGTDQFIEKKCIVAGNSIISNRLLEYTGRYFESSSIF